MEFLTASTIFSNFTNETLPAATIYVPKATSALDDLLLNIQTVLNIILLILVLLSVGCSTSLPEIFKRLKKPIGVGIALLVVYVLMPITAFVLPLIMPIDPNNQFSLYLTLCCPGGALSNLFTLASDGCVSLSITMTTVSTILSVAMIPFHLWIFGKLTSGSTNTIQVPYSSILFTLLCIIIPASVGLFIRRRWERVARVLGRICGMIGFGMLWFALGIRIYLNVDLYLSASWQQLIITFIAPLIGMGFGVALASLARMSCFKRRTICMETGGQNFTLALTIISVSFPPSRTLQELLVMPSFYAAFSFFELLAIVGLYRLYKRRQFCGPCEKEKQSEAEDITLACKVDYDSTEPEEGMANKGLDNDDNGEDDGNDLTKTEEEEEKMATDRDDENDSLNKSKQNDTTKVLEKDDNSLDKKHTAENCKNITTQTEENLENLESKLQFNGYL